MDRKWAGTQEMLDFKVTREDIEKDAKVNAKMWLRHPAYKMTLASAREGADADGDGLIDREEFKALLQASGYSGGAIQKIFAQIDADGDGQLTEAEIKKLLMRQLVEPVQWESLIKSVISSGKTSLHELGPGQQIKAMVKRIDQQCWKKFTNARV